MHQKTPKINNKAKDKSKTGQNTDRILASNI